MDYTKLGQTGLDVSRLCLGCMTFGVPDRGNHAWTLDEEASRPILRRAVEAGINFFDTANVYSDGTSEEIVGRALKEKRRLHGDERRDRARGQERRRLPEAGVGRAPPPQSRAEDEREDELLEQPDTRQGRLRPEAHGVRHGSQPGQGNQACCRVHGRHDAERRRQNLHGGRKRLDEPGELKDEGEGEAGDAKRREQTRSHRLATTA